MQILKVIGYVLGGLVAVLIVGSILLTIFPPPPGDEVLQTMSFGGKTVHIMRTGEGTVNFSAENADGAVIVNGTRLELSEGDTFTVAVSADGKVVLRPGAP